MFYQFKICGSSDLYFLETYKSVGAVSLTTVVNESLVFILCLEETAFGRHYCCGAVIVEHDVLVGIIAEFQQNACLVAFLYFIILHLVFGQEAVVSPCAVDVYIARNGSTAVQSKVNIHVFACPVVLDVVAVADVERSIGILVVEIVRAWFVGKKIGMEIRTVPTYIVNSERGMRSGKRFKLMVFVACVKDKVAVVGPLQTAGGSVLWLYVDFCIIPSSVLQYHGLYL